MAEQRNRLDLKKTIRLIDWIRANREFVESTTLDKVAPRAAGELGVAILPSNIVTAMSAVDMQPKGQRKRRDSASLQKDVTTIAEALTELYRLTGKTPPKKLTSIAQMLPLE